MLNPAASAFESGPGLTPHSGPQAGNVRMTAASSIAPINDPGERIFRTDYIFNRVRLGDHAGQGLAVARRAQG